MKCVRTGSAQNAEELFVDKQKMEKVADNCKEGIGAVIGGQVLKGLTKSLSPGRWFYSNLRTLQRLPSATQGSEWRRFHIETLILCFKLDGIRLN